MTLRCCPTVRKWDVVLLIVGSKAWGANGPWEGMLGCPGQIEVPSVAQAVS